MDIPTIFYTYPSWMVIGFAVIVSGLLFAKQDKSKQAPLPPGPKTWPIVGNAFQLPKEYEWLTYQEWSRKYGSDILYFTSWGQPHIVINSAQVASELLEKKYSLYSDRPRMPMLNELVGFDWDFSFMPYGNEWKESRKIFTQYFRPTAAVNYRPMETQKTRDLLLELLETPDNFMKLFRTLSGKIIMALVYGIEVQKINDPYVGIAERGLQGANMAGNVGTYLVDFIPALKYVPDWFPGARFKRQAREWRVDVDGMITVPYNAVKSAMENGSAVPSMLHSMLEESGENADALRSKLTASVPAVAYNAGSETILSSKLTLVLAMLLNPEIQRKAQQQLDKVVGPHRLPDFSDQSSLPYISAICKEVLRWRPVAPLAIMHKVTGDDVYRGYHIPGGSTVIANSWAILHDPATYPDPDKFSPERFLTDTGELNLDAPEPTAAFGFGRRICPGMYMASDSLWIAAASLLWAFRVEKPKGGKQDSSTGEYTSGLVSFPVPFKCAFKPRFEGVVPLIRSSAEST